jgi:L-ascorbate metabolism protein UlaG (beta-lactamase superfamily)
MIRLQIFLAVSVLFLFGTAVVYFIASKEFGAVPGSNRLARFKRSPNFDQKTGLFRNQNHRDFQSEMKVVELLKSFLLGKEIRIPSSPLPSEKPDLDFLLSDSIVPASIRLSWLGHSSVLLRVAGKTILIDPTLSNRVAPTPPFGKRFQQQPLKVEELPNIDLVLLSHDHYDHLDYESILKLESTQMPKLYVVALGVGARLESFGVSADRIHELDWWESFSHAGIQFIATPSQHFSGRGPGDAMRTFWCGFSIRTDAISVYYTGDTGYHTHFKEIAERLGPHDFALVESGQYNKLWQYVHLLPEEVVQAAIDAQVPQILPLHWGMYSISFHDWFDPVESVSKIGEEKNVYVHTPILGRVIEVTKGVVPRPGTYSKWWREHPDFKSRAP